MQIQAIKPRIFWILNAEKLLSGRSLLAGEFTFELLDSAGKVIQTVHNDASGKIEFSPITYTSTGDYDYTVRERGGLDKTIDYDAANYKVTVSIKEEAGILVATATGDAAIQFKNSYQPLGTEIHLQATKELVGKKLTDQEFTFELVNASNQVIQTAKNDALGQIRFDKLAYTKTGSYDYTIREKAGVDPQITYDTKSYKIHVEVVDQRGIDDEDTGAKLYYTDPHNQKRYDTIGTPKLAVKPDTVKSTRYQIQKENLLYL